MPTSASTSLLFAFTAATTIDAPAVFTQGASNLDFTEAGTGSCDTKGTSYSYAAGETCNVAVDFRPRVAFVAVLVLALLGLSTQGCAGGPTEYATSTGQVTLNVQ